MFLRYYVVVFNALYFSGFEASLSRDTPFYFQRRKLHYVFGRCWFLMVVIIVAALIRGKSNLVPLFVMVPGSSLL